MIQFTQYLLLPTGTAGIEVLSGMEGWQTPAGLAGWLSQVGLNYEKSSCLRDRAGSAEHLGTQLAARSAERVNWHGSVKGTEDKGCVCRAAREKIRNTESCRPGRRVTFTRLSFAVPLWQSSECCIRAGRWTLPCFGVSWAAGSTVNCVASCWPPAPARHQTPLGSTEKWDWGQVAQAQNSWAAWHALWAGHQGRTPGDAEEGRAGTQAVSNPLQQPSWGTPCTGQQGRSHLCSSSQSQLRHTPPALCPKPAAREADSPWAAQLTRSCGWKAAGAGTSPMAPAPWARVWSLPASQDRGCATGAEAGAGVLGITSIWTAGTETSQRYTAYLQYLLDVTSSKRAGECVLQCMFVRSCAAKSMSCAENAINPHSCP